jgi:hypothetical protein
MEITEVRVTVIMATVGEPQALQDIQYISNDPSQQEVAFQEFLKTNPRVTEFRRLLHLRANA